jgi:hypothetical protein
MPIRVTIEVNEREVETIHISREHKKINVDGPNIYNVVRQEPIPSYREWTDNGIQFEHINGEGILVCVDKAIQALTQQDANKE